MILTILLFIIISNFIGIVINYYELKQEIYDGINTSDYVKSNEFKLIKRSLNPFIFVFLTKLIWYNEEDFFNTKETYFLLQKNRYNKIL